MLELRVPKVWTSELQKLQNDVLRRPKALPEASWRREGLIRALWGLSLGALGELLGRFGVRCWVLWGSLWTLFGVLF